MGPEASNLIDTPPGHSPTTLMAIQLMTEECTMHDLL